MPHYGLCPYWEEESRDRLQMKCRAGVIKFPDLHIRRLVVFPYCSGRFIDCSIYKALAKAGIEPIETDEKQAD